MANFRHEKVRGTCAFCGTEDRNHCLVVHPRDPTKRRAPNNKRIRVCGDCGLVIARVVSEERNYVRYPRVEKTMETITAERTAKREKKKKERKALGKTTPPPGQMK